MKTHYLRLTLIVCTILFVLCVLFVVQTSAKQPHGYYIASNRTVVAVDGDVTNPINMSILYINDSVHGWGVITRTGYNQFRINGSLLIGNRTSANTTYFVTLKEEIVIDQYFNVTQYATFRAGEWNKTYLHSSNGSMIILNKSTKTTKTNWFRGTFELYGSMIKGRWIALYKSYLNLRFVTGSKVRINESNMENFLYAIWDQTTDIMLNHVYFTSTEAAVNPLVIPSYVWNDIVTDSCLYLGTSGSFTVWNLAVYRGHNAYQMRFSTTSAQKLQLINCVSINTSMLSSAGTTDNTWMTLNYTFRLRVTNSSGINLSGARVSIKDVFGTELYNSTTSTYGIIPQQILCYQKWYRKSSSGYLHINITYTKHTLRINKTGYQTYIGKFFLQEPKNFTIALQNLTGLVVANNAVGCAGTIEYEYRSNTGVNGEWWVWVNLTGGISRCTIEILSNKIYWLPCMLLVCLIIGPIIIEEEKKRRKR